MSEDTRNALNALLYNTSSASHKFMMVLATNRAEVGLVVHARARMTGIDDNVCPVDNDALKSSTGFIQRSEGSFLVGLGCLVCGAPLAFAELRGYSI